MRCRKPDSLWALDLFCGGGGAALGLLQAGFDVVVGIDHKPRRNYPGFFIQADALTPPVILSDFDFVWASPPCQAYSCRSPKYKMKHPDLVSDVRNLLNGHPWTCIENVPGSPVRPDVVLTGPSMNLPKIQRNRHFELSFFMLYPPPLRVPRAQWVAGEAYTITTSLGASAHFYPRKSRGLPGALTKSEAKVAMGIPLAHQMTRHEIGEAVPPPYAKFIADAVVGRIKV